MVTPRNLQNSPLAVFGLCIGALVTWSLGYQAFREPTAAAEAPQAESPTAHPPLLRAIDRAVPQVEVPSVRPPPRLRLPHGEDDPPGLELALEDRDGRSMDGLHNALRRAARGEGRARLVFYGASHTASDLYTGLLRRELQRQYGDAGHGFVLPAHPWRSYRHQGVTIESDRNRWTALKIGPPPQLLDHYGLAGVAVESDAAGAWGLVRTDDRGSMGRVVGLFDLYYLEQPGGGDFDVLIDGRAVQRIQTSHTERRPGYATFRVPEGPHELKVVVRGNGPVRIFGVSMERESPGVIVDTVGINGARARSHLLWEDFTYREHLRRLEPDLVALAYGTNESGDIQPMEEYVSDIRQVLGRIRETVPDASCLIIGPSDRPVRITRDTYEHRPRTDEIVEALWRVSLEHGCAFFDMVAFQGGPMSMVSWNAHEPPYAAPDHVHYTRHGYTRFGEVLLGALLEGFTAEGGDAPRARPSTPRGAAAAPATESVGPGR